MAKKMRIVIIVRCEFGHIVDAWLGDAPSEWLLPCNKCYEDTYEWTPSRSIEVMVLDVR